MRTNEFNQPIGEALPHFSVGELPTATLLQGRVCRLEKLSVEQHGTDLEQVFAAPEPHWTYLSLKRFENSSDLHAYLKQLEISQDPYYFAIVDEKQGKAVGLLALMRIDPNHRTIEVGWVIYAPELQKTTLATEAQYLLAKYVVEVLQYRRYEWKCDCLNEPSQKAAKRLGFTYEGTFRQAAVYKGRNRDTAWFSMLDTEWESRKKRFGAWLSEDNFDDYGRQKISLSEL